MDTNLVVDRLKELRGWLFDQSVQAAGLAGSSWPTEREAVAAEDSARLARERVDAVDRAIEALTN